MTAASYPPIAIHPDNPKLFRFRGAPRVLITATEHYGAVMNRPFRFERYLADMADKGLTLTRLFVLFRELQSAVNPYSTCKPESTDYIAPYPRLGPGMALDGQPQYDLGQWNQEFFDRLERFLALASQYGIMVEITLLSNTYAEAIWALHPLHPANHPDGWDAIPWHEYMSLRHPRLVEAQLAHVRKIVEATRRFDNIIYEPCNEPGGLAAPGAPTLDEVNAWQMAIVEEIRRAEAGGPRHLIAGQEAFAYQLPGVSRDGLDVHQLADASFDALDFDVVNMHPLSNMVSRGRRYHLGRFMQGELRLRRFRDYCLDLYCERKPLNLDEDNAATQYRDDFGWTIHRKRAWTALCCGAHYNCIDFTINNYLETGTPQSQCGLRAPFGQLAACLHRLDLARARPCPGVVVTCPEPVVASALGVEGEDYCIYLADARERGDIGAGGEITGTLVLDLPAAPVAIACLSPRTGCSSPAISLTGGPRTAVTLPPFREDLVVRVHVGER